MSDVNDTSETPQIYQECIYFDGEKRIIQFVLVTGETREIIQTRYERLVPTYFMGMRGGLTGAYYPSVGTVAPDKWVESDPF